MHKCIVLFFITFSFIIADSSPNETVKDKDTVAPLMTTDQIFSAAKNIMRVEVEWMSNNDSYHFSYAVIESSGTEELHKRTKNVDPFGSYRGVLSDPVTNTELSYNSLGTGQEYRKLSRSLTFRFPIPSKVVTFSMIAENPQSGVMEEVLTHTIDPQSVRKLELKKQDPHFDDLEVRLLHAAKKSPKLIVNVYAEGYTVDRRDTFWREAPKVVNSLKSKTFPMMDHLEFRGVFAPSNKKLGEAKKLGFPIPERDSFLGLYFPYWNDFGRWYHVIYPTRESRFRRNIGLVPYDYPIVLVDSADYWGVGNFKEHTAIPSRSGSFTYLLMHEFGHYFGLNEEYDGGGKTELAFAPGIREPWSQNITFSSEKAAVKWKRVITKGIPVPTPKSYWDGNGPYGLYRGGYAQTQPFGRSYKPGLSCIMDRGTNFCDVCRLAIVERIRFDLGLTDRVFHLPTKNCCNNCK